MSNHFSEVHDALLYFVREQMTDPVIVLDAEGRVVGANRAATVWGDLEVLAAFNGLSGGGAPSPQVAAFWAELREKGQAKREFSTHHSISRYFELSGFAVADRYVIHGRESASVATSMVHDLNDVLAPILLLCGVLRRERSNRIKRIAEDIEAAAGRAADLARRLRTVPRPMPPPVERIDIGAAVLALREAIESVVGGDIAVAIEIEDGLPATLVDRERLVHVVLNLAANARDTMPDGGRLTLRVAEVHLDAGPGPAIAGPHVALTIADTGSKPESEARGHSFSPGLALTAARALAADAGGLISVSNQPNQGTLIALYFPRAERS